MPDVATPRNRTVSISGGGGFGIDSAAVFNPHYNIGAGDTPSRQTWLANSLVKYWGKSVQVTISGGTGLVSGSTSTPSITLTIHYGTFTKSVTVHGTPYLGNSYSSPASYSVQYFATSSGTFTFTEVVSCYQHLNPQPYEVRTPVSFTCSASIVAHFVDTVGSGTQTISASLTMTDADISGFTGLTYSNYDYSFGYGGIGVHYDISANIGFDQPGLISTFTGINTHWGKPTLTGNGSAVTWHWNGTESDLNPDWSVAGGSGPTAELQFFPSWALALVSNVYHYRDKSEVGATLQHWYGNLVVNSFASGSAYRYPASGLVHYILLGTFTSGQVRDGSGMQPGSQDSSDSNYNSLGGLVGSDYGPIGLLFQVPGQPIGQTTAFLFSKAWADGYGTYLHPNPPANTWDGLYSMVMPPYQEGTIAIAATHRFQLFEAVGISTALSAPAASSDTVFHVVSSAGFAPGDQIQVGVSTYTLTSVSAGQLNISGTVGSSFPAGTVVLKAPSRWTATSSPATFPGAAPLDPAPGIIAVSGTGIDGTALQVTCAGSCEVTTTLRYLLKHMAYRHARLRLRSSPPATTLTAAVAAGATDLPVTSSAGFRVGDFVDLGADHVVITAVASGHLTTAALPNAHASGAAVERSGAGRVLLELAGSRAGHYGWMLPAGPSAKLTAAVVTGATFLPLDNTTGFEAGQQVRLGAGGSRETLTISSVASGGIGVGALAGPHGAGEPVTLAPGQWWTANLDLARPGFNVISGTWTPTTDWVPPAVYFPELQPSGYLGASAGVYLLDAGTYAFDYLEGYQVTGGTHKPWILFPHLWQVGDGADLTSYEQPPPSLEAGAREAGGDRSTGTDTPPGAFGGTQIIRGVTNGVEGWKWVIDTSFTSQTQIWQHYQATLDNATTYTAPGGDTLPNDTGITIVLGTAGDPDTKMVFFSTGDYADAFLSGAGGAADPMYGLLPVAGTPQVIMGQLRTGNTFQAYYGAGDLTSASGGYAALVTFHGDWIFDGEALCQTGAVGASVILADNDTGATFDAGPSDDDGLVRLSSHYGVVLPYGNVSGTAQFSSPPPAPSTTTTALLSVGDTQIHVADSSIAVVGDLIAFTGFGGGGTPNMTVLAVAAGVFTVAAVSFTMGSGSTLSYVPTAHPPLVYTSLGKNLNADWLKGQVAPLDGAGYWSDPGTVDDPRPTRRLIVILDRYQSVYYPTGRFFRGVWNMHDRLGSYHRADVVGGKIRYHRADLPTPPFVIEVDATAGPSDSEPRMAPSAMDRVHLLFTRGTDVMLIWSDDDGETWSDPMALFTGGKHPANAPTDVGTVIHAVYLGGHIQAKEEIAPQQWSPAWTFIDDTGAAIAVDDDSFSFSMAPEGAGRHLLVATAGGDVKEWVSADDARTFVLVT